jgi:hypothetical protein
LTVFFEMSHERVQTMCQSGAGGKSVHIDAQGHSGKVLCGESAVLMARDEQEGVVK